MLSKMLAIAVGMAFAAPRDSVASLPKSEQKPLTAVAIKAFFEGSDAVKTAENVAKIEGSRLQALFRYFPSTDVQSVKQASKEYRELVEKEHEKDGGKKSSAYKVASVRASNVQTLYGGWRFENLKPEGLGYHDAVAEATKRLQAKNLKWDGSHVPTKDERAIDKEANMAGRLAYLTEKDRLKFERSHPGEEMTAEKVEEIRQQNADALRKAGAIDMARKLYEKQGAEFCGWVINALEANIAKGEQEQQNEATAKAEQRAAA